MDIWFSVVMISVVKTFGTDVMQPRSLAASESNIYLLVTANNDIVKFVVGTFFNAPITH